MLGRQKSYLFALRELTLPWFSVILSLFRARTNNRVKADRAISLLHSSMARLRATMLHGILFFAESYTSEFLVKAMAESSGYTVAEFLHSFAVELREGGIERLSAALFSHFSVFMLVHALMPGQISFTNSAFMTGRAICSRTDILFCFGRVPI